ncbi:MBOAT family O-acyltransferase [Hathewaya limosa]|nr:MBOAT family O-acyltransferase [Hathewaya limosa]
MNNKIVLPIGISFFTFQMMSYIIDVYREEVTPQKSIINLGLYIMLFPQLIAGPIVRYIDIEEQINTRKVNLYKFTHGMERFIIGLSKKVLIANSNGFIVDYVFKEPSFYSNTVLVWLGIVCYALQIYYDFSGYSDMAIGLGKMFGFDFLENFNYPYISKSIKEFWRRWHISLSTWFRDYLYIPLGGSKVGKFKTYRNLVIVFFATGLWHGASWNFIIWGLFHGMFLILERGKFGELLQKVPTILQRIYTMLVVLVGWVFFRANNFKLALKYIKGMFKVDFTKVNQIYGVIDKEYMFFIIIGIIFSTPLIKKLNSLFNSKIKTENNLIIVITEGMWIAILMSMFIISILYITGSNFNPFIYFRF